LNAVYKWSDIAPGCSRSHLWRVSALRSGSASIRSPVAASVEMVAYRWPALEGEVVHAEDPRHPERAAAAAA
jgi:hypothetical protein